MQCKDLDTLAILRFIGSFDGAWCSLMPPRVTERSVFNAMPPETPWKVGWRKMESLITRGLVEGCPCGCRGDFYLTDKGKAFVAEADAKLDRELEDAIIVAYRRLLANATQFDDDVMRALSGDRSDFYI